MTLYVCEVVVRGDVCPGDAGMAAMSSTVTIRGVVACTGTIRVLLYHNGGLRRCNLSLNLVAATLPHECGFKDTIHVNHSDSRMVQRMYPSSHRTLDLDL